MGKTTRRSPIGDEHGCFDGYYERRGYRGWMLCNPSKMDEERLAEDRARERKRWNARCRDGRIGYYTCEGTGSRKYFRTLSKRHIRAGTRMEIARARASGDWDDAVFPETRDGKKFIWAVW